MKDPEKVLSRQLRGQNSHTKRCNWKLHYIEKKGMISVYWWHKPDGKPPIIEDNGRRWNGIPLGKYPNGTFIAVHSEKEL